MDLQDLQDEIKLFQEEMCSIIHETITNLYEHGFKGDERKFKDFIKNIQVYNEVDSAVRSVIINRHNINEGKYISDIVEDTLGRSLMIRKYIKTCKKLKTNPLSYSEKLTEIIYKNIEENINNYI